MVRRKKHCGVMIYFSAKLLQFSRNECKFDRIAWKHFILNYHLLGELYFI